MSTDIAAFKIEELQNEIARLKNQTNWVCKCGGTDCEGQRENAALRAEVDQWASRCAAAIWMLPEKVTGGELREAQDKLHRERENLRRENAELRKDKERLDWLATLTGSGWACLHLHRKDTIDGWLLTRKQIDRRMGTEPKP